VHRDAEGETLERRVIEIKGVVADLPDPLVPVVPVRMQEAWLLIDEPALRCAAGNPNGVINLDMPAIDRLEGIPNPKQVLHELLLDASELTGRRRTDLYYPGITRGAIAWISTNIGRARDKRRIWSGWNGLLPFVGKPYLSIARSVFLPDPPGY